MKTATLLYLMLVAACSGKSSDASREEAARPATAARRRVPAVPPAHPPGPPIHFAGGTGEGDMVLSTRIDGCQLHLDFFSTWGSARLRAVSDLPGPCTAPLALRLERLTDMVIALQNKIVKRPPFRHFGFYGRSADYVEMTRRVASSAARSPDWDARLGRSLAGPITLLVNRLADQAEAYPEVIDLFAGFGYTAHLAGVEKVIVLPARELPYAKWLASEGVSPDARLPSDYMFGFRITPRLVHK